MEHEEETNLFLIRFVHRCFDRSNNTKNSPFLLRASFFNEKTHILELEPLR